MTKNKIEHAAFDVNGSLTGQMINHWAILDDSPVWRVNNRRGVLAVCSCGTFKVVHRRDLLNGKSKSCGCVRVIKAKAKGHNPIGERFTRLVVICQAGMTKTGTRQFKCLCDCGNEVVTTLHRLQKGLTKSCGCLRAELLQKAAHDPVGERFGRLRVIRFEKRDQANNRLFYCKCDCGGSTVTSLSHLRDGHTQSCGCYARDMMRLANTTIAKEFPAEHRVWSHMKSRCFNTKNVAYSRYGGRGITVCEEWIHDFSAFIRYIGRRPGDSYSIDRINNNRNYEPGNVRWATAQQQNQNSRAAKLTFGNVALIQYLYRRFGWDKRIIANYFSVSKDTINCIISGRTWKNVYLGEII